MKVSIIIPTFNRANYLEHAISSALAQDYADLEVIISDNASTDNTELVSRLFLNDSKVRYFRNEENIGMVRNWHKAVYERMSGEWFVILSDDDILINPRFVSQAVELIKNSKNITVVYSDSYVYDQALNTVVPLKLPFKTVENGDFVFSQRGTIRPQDFALCNVLFNRRLSIENSAFLNANNFSCDTELFLRLCLKGQVGVIKEYSSIYRIHSENLLKTVSKNTELIEGSLDSLLGPLMEAEHRNLDSKVLREFILNSRLKREILVCLLKISSSDRARAIALYNRLQQLFQQKNYDVLPGKVFFNLLLMISKILTPLFLWRRRALYLFNATKRLIFGKQTYFKYLQRKVYFINS